MLVDCRRGLCRGDCGKGLVMYCWLIGIPLVWVGWSIAMLFRKDTPETVNDWCGEVFCVAIWPFVLLTWLALVIIAPFLLLGDCISNDREYRKARAKEQVRRASA